MDYISCLMFLKMSYALTLFPFLNSYIILCGQGAHIPAEAALAHWPRPLHTRA